MNKSQNKESIDWKHHAEQAVKFDDGVYQYAIINNLSKTSIYKWIKYYSQIDDLKLKPKPKKYKSSKKLKKESSFLPVLVKPSESLVTSRYQNQLPDSQWVAEIITNVIRGLM